jgi:hypothetical protein
MVRGNRIYNEQNNYVDFFIGTDKNSFHSGMKQFNAMLRAE